MRVIVLAVLVAATAAPALEWVFLETDADSYVRRDAMSDDGYYHEWSIDNNYGDEPRLYVGGFYYKESTDLLTFLHFDFSTLAPYGYGGDDLVQARLVFRAEKAASHEVYVHLLRDPWEEMTVTYRNQPGKGLRVAEFYMVEGNNYVDLKRDAVAKWVDKPEEAYGFGLYMETTRDSYEGIIYSREGGVPAQLRLLFSGPAVEEASWGEIKARF